MHPILFEIPLPERPVPLLHLFIGIAVLLALLAAYSFFRSTRASAVTFGLAALGAAGAAMRYSGETWDMGPVPIYSYGVMLGLSLVVGWYLTLGLAERDGLPKEIMANCYVVTAIAAVAGSRILYVFTNLDEFQTFGSVFAMRSGGLVAYGGFLGGFIGSYAYLKRYKLPLLPWADVAVPSLASGLMITRIGCYLFGCDFGRPLKESAPEWLKNAGTFPHWISGTLENGDGAPAWVQHVKERGLPQSATHSLPVHPTQLYESAIGLALLVMLLWARRYQQFRGQIFLLFTFAYGYARFLVETLRDDPERNSVPPSMSEHILLPLCLAILAVAFTRGISMMIERQTVRRIAQVASFVPPLVAYFWLRPESFAGSVRIELSTSQFIGLASAVGAAVAFSMFYKAAQKNPAAAMALDIPPELLDRDDEDEDEDEPEEKARPASGKKGSGKAAKAGAKASAARPTKAKKSQPTPASEEAPDETDEQEEEEEEEEEEDQAPDSDADDDSDHADGVDEADEDETDEDETDEDETDEDETDEDEADEDETDEDEADEDEADEDEADEDEDGRDGGKKG